MLFGVVAVVINDVGTPLDVDAPLGIVIALVVFTLSNRCGLKYLPTEESVTAIVVALGTRLVKHQE